MLQGMDQRAIVAIEGAMDQTAVDEEMSSINPPSCIEIFLSLHSISQ